MDQAEFVEIAVGATILGLRRINIARRDLAEKIPEAEPAIDELLARLDTRVEPTAAALAGVIDCVGEAIGGDTGNRMRHAAPTLRALGPKLVHMSGLTAPIWRSESADREPTE